MSGTPEVELASVTRRMVQALEHEYTRWMTSGSSLPMPLVSLMKTTHDAVLKQIQGKGLNTDGKSYADLLVELDQMRAELIRLVRMDEEMKELDGESDADADADAGRQH